MLSASERRQVLEEWSAAQSRAPSDRCVHELFAEQAAATDAVALVFGEERVTRSRAGRPWTPSRASLILGVGPDVRVAICAERTPELAVALLAILKAGGAYVPLDPAYPAERLAYMVWDAGVRVLVTQESLRGGAGVRGARSWWGTRRPTPPTAWEGRAA